MKKKDLEEAEKLVQLWNEKGAPTDVQLKLVLKDFLFKMYSICIGSFRMVKKKLPKDIRKKIEEWKLSSGALVMCIVAYSDGHSVNGLQ